MTYTRESLLEQIQSLRDQLYSLLAGMDYCLDWKPSQEDWSARQVLYHLLDTPEGGLHAAAIRLLNGDIHQLTIHSHLANITPENEAADLPQVLDQMDAALTALEKLVTTSSDADLYQKQVVAHLPAHHATETCDLATLIGRALETLWQDHLHQLAELREALGIT